MFGRKEIAVLIAVFLLLPSAALAADINYTVNPVEVDCTGADSIEIYNITLDDYVPGYAVPVCFMRMI